MNREVENITRTESKVSKLQVNLSMERPNMIDYSRSSP